MQSAALEQHLSHSILSKLSHNPTKAFQLTFACAAVGLLPHHQHCWQQGVGSLDEKNGWHVLSPLRCTQRPASYEVLHICRHANFRRAGSTQQAHLCSLRHLPCSSLDGHQPFTMSDQYGTNGQDACQLEGGGWQLSHGGVSGGGAAAAAAEAPTVGYVAPAPAAAVHAVVHGAAAAKAPATGWCKRAIDTAIADAPASYESRASGGDAQLAMPAALQDHMPAPACPLY
eukprot:1147403-Pelagomonas_calceolata.AAC.1